MIKKCFFKVLFLKYDEPTSAKTLLRARTRSLEIAILKCLKASSAPAWAPACLPNDSPISKPTRAPVSRPILRPNLFPALPPASPPGLTPSSPMSLRAAASPVIWDLLVVVGFEYFYLPISRGLLILKLVILYLYFGIHQNWTQFQMTVLTSNDNSNK